MNKRNYFWGVEYFGGNKTCTKGLPNPVTKRLSLAIKVSVFKTKTERDEWVTRQPLREAANKKKIRSMMLGLTDYEFVEFCERAISSTDLFGK